MSVIQQVYLAEAGYSIYIKGIKPDKDNVTSTVKNPALLIKLSKCQNSLADVIKMRRTLSL